MRVAPSVLPLLALLPLAACGPSSNGDAREALVVNTLVKADEVHARARPALVAGKFARMAASPYDFYRGNLPLFRADWEAARTSRSGFVAHTPVLGLGDPHPENFGLLAARDGTLALEPNDFDAADRVPWLFDLRRLVVGLAVGFRAQHPDALGAEQAAGIARAAARAYAEALLAFADDPGVAAERVTAAGDSLVLQDLFRRGQRDLLAHAELSQLTEATETGPRFRRGVLDPAEPTATLEDLSAEVLARLPEALARLDGAEVLDAVRQFGSGVSSWPRVRVLVLLAPRGEELAPVVVELKELPDSTLAGWYRPPVAADTPARVEASLRRAWAVPDADPRWFCTTWWGLPLQVRTEAEGHKGVKVSRWVGARGTAVELTKLAAVLGRLLARVHARSEAGPLRDLTAQLARDPDAFSDEQAAFAVAESTQTLEDFARFQHARETLGPLLGLSPDARDLPGSAASVALFTPPPLPAADDLDGGAP